MRWTVNGLVVTSVTPGQFSSPDDKYCGIAYGEPWPLQSLDVARGSAVYEMIHLLWDMHMDRYVIRSDGWPSESKDGLSEHPTAIPDLDIALEYIRLCDELGINTRKFLCATTCPYPEMDVVLSDRLLSQSRFLGYDYISNYFGFSPVQGESGCEDSESLPEWLEEFGLTEAAVDGNRRLMEFSRFLNEFGLFDNEIDLKSYITTMWEIAEKTTGPTIDDIRYSYLETSEELWPCKTWELHYI